MPLLRVLAQLFGALVDHLAPLRICCSEQGREEVHAYVRVHVREL